jgi:hypothetical protein
MKTVLTITRYNITALIGWVGVIVGLVGASVQYFIPSAPGIYLLAVGLVGGGIAVSLAGPWRTITTRQVDIQTQFDKD